MKDKPIGHRQFNAATNVLIVIWLLGFAAIYGGPRVATWIRPAGHVLVALGLLIAAALYAMRASGRLGWYSTEVRRWSSVSAAAATASGGLYFLDFVVGVPRPVRLLASVSLLVAFVAFLLSILPDLLPKRGVKGLR